MDCALAVEVADTPETGLATCEGEHGQRDRDGKVNTNLTAVGLVLELSGSVTILGEDSTTITASMIVHKVNSLLKSVNSHDDHDGSEDLLIVNVHAWLDVVNDRGADEVSLLKAWDLDASSIENDLGLLGA